MFSNVKRCVALDEESTLNLTPCVLLQSVKGFGQCWCEAIPDHVILLTTLTVIAISQVLPGVKYQDELKIRIHPAAITCL